MAAHAALHRSRLSVAVVLQAIGVPAVVTPRAPATLQNAPGCTTGRPPVLGEGVAGGLDGWAGAGVPM